MHPQKWALQMASGHRYSRLMATAAPPMVTSYTVPIGWAESSDLDPAGGALALIRSGGSFYSPKQVADRRIKRLIRRLR